MAGYTSKWTCRICASEQDTIQKPNLRACDECLGAVATRLCHDALGVPFDAPGVDAEYWLRAADRLVGPMLKRWQPPAQGAIVKPTFHPLGGASRGVGRCTCPAGRGTDPACVVHP